MFIYTHIMWFDATYGGKKPIQTKKKKKRIDNSNNVKKEAKNHNNNNANNNQNHNEKGVHSKKRKQIKASESFSVAKNRQKAGDVICYVQKACNGISIAFFFLQVFE